MRFRASILALFALSTAHAADYTYEDGFDRPGRAFDTFELTHDPLPVLCGDACYAKPECKAFVFVKPSADRHAVCRLLDSEPAPIEDACCIAAVKGKPMHRAAPAFELAWLGGEQFDLRLALPPETIIEAIELRVPGDNGRWSSRDGTLEVGGAGGSARTLDTRGGMRWGAGGIVTAELTLAGGRTIAHTVVIAAPPDKLIGRWQSFCASGNFEPRTVDGDLLLNWNPDGSVSGAFDSIPVRGTVDASGKLTAIAQDAKNRVELEGTFENPRRGRPLSGHGSFRFTRAEDPCVQPGSWSGP